MHKALLPTLLILLLAASTAMAGSVVAPDCTFKGKRLYGKIQVVKSFPDLKVQVVQSFPDLKVEKVKSFPDKCGKWQFVEYGEDFTVQFVESFPDIKIKYVDSFPGVE